MRRKVPRIKQSNKKHGCFAKKDHNIFFLRERPEWAQKDEAASKTFAFGEKSYKSQLLDYTTLRNTAI